MFGHAGVIILIFFIVINILTLYVMLQEEKNEEIRLIPAKFKVIFIGLVNCVAALLVLIVLNVIYWGWGFPS